MKCSFQKLSGERIVFLPIKIMDIIGRYERAWLETGAQRPELIERNIRIIGGMGGKEGTGKLFTGPQSEVEVKEFFSSLVQKRKPFPGLPCVHVDAVMCHQIAGSLQTAGQGVQAAFIYLWKRHIIGTWRLEPVVAQKTVAVVRQDAQRVLAKRTIGGSNETEIGSCGSSPQKIRKRPGVIAKRIVDIVLDGSAYIVQNLGELCSWGQGIVVSDDHIPGFCQCFDMAGGKVAFISVEKPAAVEIQDTGPWV